MIPNEHDATGFFDRGVNWLANSDIRENNGIIYSWINPEHPGYLYPEIMGYYVKLFSYFYQKTGRQKFLERAVQTADSLAGLVTPTGSVSREGIEYVFDSAICLSGLIALSRVSAVERYKKQISLLSGFVFKALENETVAFSNKSPINDNESWSLSFGASSLKACIALQEAADFLSDNRHSILAEKTADKIISSCFKGNYFTINAEKPWVYTHPHCYATEALLFFDKSAHRGIITKSADWLANQQNEDGSLFGWYTAPGKPQEKQGDATAQALRIWLSVDKEKYSRNSAKAFAFLNALQTKEGGLFYNKGSQDINSWVTMFASQAAQWLVSGAEREWIV